MKRLILLLAALCLLSACAAPASNETGQAPAEPAEQTPAVQDGSAAQDDAPTDDSAPVLVCGDYAMTSAQFQYFFGHQYAAILDAYADSAFDPSKDLGGQRYDENQTWAEFLTDQALTLAEQTERLCLAAKDAGFEPIEGEVVTDEQAKSQGYADAAAMLEALYGEGAALETYLDFARDMATSAAYSMQLNAGECTDAEIEAYYDANAENYETVFHLPKNDDRTLDVRIIRFYPNDTGDEADWAETEARARAVEAEYQKNPTDETFAALADKYTEDFNAPDGCLYTGICPGGQNIIDEWLYPAGGVRAEGDTALIRENAAVALCRISAVGDRPYWMLVARQDLLQDNYMKTMDALREAYVFERHPENIDLRVPTAHQAGRFEGVEAVG